MKTPKRTPGSINFEPTNFDEAREAFEEPPGGVQNTGNLSADSPESQQHKLKGQRRAPSSADTKLTNLTLDWLINLPPNVRPTELSDRFPRVTNALAMAWPNADYCELLFGHLLINNRGARQGFPQSVAGEIEQLYQYRIELNPPSES